MNQTSASPQPSPGRAILVGLMFVGFISLGLPDGLLGVAWPSLAASRGVPLAALGQLLIASSVGFIAASVWSGRLIHWLGVGGLLAAAATTTAMSLLSIALAPGWAPTLVAALFLGAGGGCIDGGLNNYAAATTSPRVLTWLHAFYGVGATAGPLLMTAILSNQQPWQRGYLLVGSAQLGLALAFALSRRRWTADGSPERHAVRSTVTLTTTLRLPKVWLGILIFVLYTGLEVSAGQWAYTLFTLGRGVDPATAGLWVALYWGGLTLGRFVAGAVANRLSPPTLLWMGALGALVGAALIGAVSQPWANLSGMLVLGAALAPIFPALIGTTADRVGGEHAANAIGVQVAAANLGAALIPWLVGLAAGVLGFASLGPLILAVAVAYVVLFWLAR